MASTATAAAVDAVSAVQTSTLRAVTHHRERGGTPWSWSRVRRRGGGADTVWVSSLPVRGSRGGSGEGLIGPSPRASRRRPAPKVILPPRTSSADVRGEGNQ